MDIFLYVAIAIIIGLLSTRLMKLLKLPNVTGYLLTGVIIGPFVLGTFFTNVYDLSTPNNLTNNPIFTFINTDLSWITSLALGFIAFTIGSSFRIQTVKKVGKRVIVITCLEALGAAVLVFLGLMVGHFIIKGASGTDSISWPLVLTLAAISCATAPAATLLVIRQYKAKGPVVDTLLPVVALDDAAALIMFSILFSLAKSIELGSGTFDFYAMLAKPFIEILLSLVFGAILGFAVSFACKFFKSRANRTIWCIFSIFAALGLTILFKNSWCGGFELSSLLICMMSGAIFINFRKDSDLTLDVIDKMTPPIFMLFFIVSGAQLNLTVFTRPNAGIIILIAAIYIICRVIGKWTGAFTGACLTKAEPTVKKYLGFTLIPQAGVAIGLATTAGRILDSNGSDLGDIVVAVILTSTIIYELVGPAITKITLIKAGEIETIKRTPTTNN